MRFDHIELLVELGLLLVGSGDNSFYKMPLIPATFSSMSVIYDWSPMHHSYADSAS
jgi:hypothetical protein